MGQATRDPQSTILSVETGELSKGMTGTELGFLSVLRTQNYPSFLNLNWGHEKVMKNQEESYI